MAALIWRMLLGSIACVVTVAAVAADCPEPACFQRPPKLIVTSPAGSKVDVLARFMAMKMQAPLGQPVVVENVAGRGGIVAASALAKSAPDSETILIAPTYVLTLNTQLYRQPGFEAKDIVPVALVASAPQVLLVSERVQAKSLKELVALAKRDPGRLKYASFGGGTFSHMVMEQLQQGAGVKLEHVPYKGLGPASQDLLSGQIDMMMVDVGSVGQLKEKTRAVAITGQRRSPLLPEIPTFEEQGISDFQDGISYGLVYPAGTHPNVVSRLNTAVRKSIESGDAREFFAKNGFDTANPSQQAFASQLRTESERWAKVVKTSAIKLD